MSIIYALQCKYHTLSTSANNSLHIISHICTLSTGEDKYYKFDPKDFGERLGESTASLTSEAAKAGFRTEAAGTGFQSDWRTAEEAAMERR